MKACHDNPWCMIGPRIELLAKISSSRLPNVNSSGREDVQELEKHDGKVTPEGIGGKEVAKLRNAAYTRATSIRRSLCLSQDR